MARKFLDENGLLYLWSKIKARFVAQESGKGLSTNDYTDAEQTKLAGIETGATKTVVENVLTSTSTTNALSAAQGKVLKDAIDGINTSIEDLGTGDMLKSTYDTDNDGVVDNAAKLGGQLPSYYAKASDIPTIDTALSGTSTNPVQNKVINTALAGKAESSHTHTLDDVTETTAKKIMTADERTKLSGIAANANNYSLPTASATVLGGVKVGTNLTITNGVLAAKDTTYSAATTSAEGLLSAEDKTKLDGIAANANNYSHPNSGVTAGTYKSVTVNAQGHVTAGTNPTTLSGYGITNAYTKTETDSAISTAVANAGHLKRSIVDALPAIASADANTIYMILADDTSTDNKYIEWMAINGKFEKIGDTDVDLSNYMQTSDMVAITNAEIDTIVAA